MIQHENGVFRLSTAATSYWFRVGQYGHMEHIYYGAKLHDKQDVEPLMHKHTSMLGSQVVYDESDPRYSLDVVPLEWSGIGVGDYRYSPAEIKMPDGSFRCDFIYESYALVDGSLPADGLPGAYDGEQTLTVTLRDKGSSVRLLLYYTVYPDCDVITRRASLVNADEKPLCIRRLLSMSVDMPNKGFDLVTLDGGWIKEANRHVRPVEYGQYVNASTTGASSNRHNPGVMLASRGASESYGEIYAINLIYSGNHFTQVELSNTDLVRISSGINPHCFAWELQPGERFDTPEAVLCYSNTGYNGASAHLHDFVNRHIVRGEWKNKERPVLLNDWEACFFKFTGRKLTRLARQAKRLGVELFVLDDGWFGKRNTDTAGLGDYTVNRRKLPHGLDGFANTLGRMGMRFGLWFEPEMVNEDSDLFRAHPEYAVTTPNRKPLCGRHQLVLDLCNPDVRDYIVRSVGGVLDSANITYVKWDMNRHISDAYSRYCGNQGEFFHRYILGLYDVLRRIFSVRPHILLESCSSGGNRFDLGMLCYSPQIWASDNTDPIERLRIQEGLSLFYPQSTFGAHVSMTPHSMTLRAEPVSTRFNVSAFGCLGYELDIKHLTCVERREIKRQIEFYKLHRRTLQYGRMVRHAPVKPNKAHWQVSTETESVAGFYQTLATASEGNDFLPLSGFSPDARYRVTTVPQRIYIGRFGGLLKHIMPFELKPDGFLLRTANKLFALNDCVETYECFGDALNSGIRLANQYEGCEYNDHIRMLGDFGSNLYLVERIAPDVSP